MLVSLKKAILATVVAAVIRTCSCRPMNSEFWEKVFKEANDAEAALQHFPAPPSSAQGSSSELAPLPETITYPYDWSMAPGPAVSGGPPFAYHAGQETIHSESSWQPSIFPGQSATVSADEHAIPHYYTQNIRPSFPQDVAQPSTAAKDADAGGSQINQGHLRQKTHIPDPPKWQKFPDAPADYEVPEEMTEEARRLVLEEIARYIWTKKKISRTVKENKVHPYMGKQITRDLYEKGIGHFTAKPKLYTRRAGDQYLLIRPSQDRRAPVNSQIYGGMEPEYGKEHHLYVWQRLDEQNSVLRLVGMVETGIQARQSSTFKGLTSLDRLSSQLKKSPQFNPQPIRRLGEDSVVRMV